VPADANDPATRPERERVKVGSYVLVVGDPAGTEIKAAAGQVAAGQAKLRLLEQAITQVDGESEPPHTGVDPLDRAVDDAAEVTSKVELALSLFTQIVQGGLDAAAIDGEVEALLDLLARLDREERWEESLRLVRALAKLLALLQRWLQLLQSLRTALRAAKRFDNHAGQAWALHEQGTLYLAAEKHADAASLLSEAHDLRHHLKDTHGLTITDHNLQVLCNTLRARLHPSSLRSWLERIVERPVTALILAMSLLLLGGVAGAVIRGSGGTRSITVTTTTTNPTPPVGKRSSISPETVSIIANPESISVEPEHDASFTATARGIPAPTVQWEESRDEGRTFSAIPIATSTVLTVKAVETTYNGREYRAVFTNSTGARTSKVATLTVSTPRTVTVE
jgi:immunoglobulin I-set domain protein